MRCTKSRVTASYFVDGVLPSALNDGSHRFELVERDVENARKVRDIIFTNAMVAVLGRQLCFCVTHTLMKHPVEQEIQKNQTVPRMS
jgi:hypothetical protein